MYHPLTVCVEKEGWVKDYLWTNTLVPGGARGVAIKSKFLLMDAWSERHGLVWEYLSRLRVITAWGMR